MECDLGIRNGKNPPGAGIGNDNRSRFTLHQMADERLEMIRRVQVLRADEGNHEDGQTSSEFTELKCLGNALHRHSTWHIKRRKSNGQKRRPKFSAHLAFKVRAAADLTPSCWQEWMLTLAARICYGVFFPAVF